MSVDQFDFSGARTATDAVLVLLLYQFGECLRDHPAFQNRQPHVPGSDTFTGHAVALQKVSLEAQQGGKQKKEERDNLREKIYVDLTFAGQHAVMVATHRNDPSMLNNMVFSLKQRSYSKGPQKLPEKPSKITARQEGPPGTIVVSLNRCTGQGSIEIQITDDPRNEASWRSLERSYTCKITVGELELVKRYYIRGRYHNNAGYGPWSEEISIVLS